MPFVGHSDGETVTPEEVTRDDHITCPSCGDEFGIRDRHERDGSFVARHFWHPTGSKQCSGGESDVHRRLKAIALSKLKHEFKYRDAGLERKIGDHIADVYASFQTRSKRWGWGVVVEVQYRNTGKDKEAVTRNYLGNGFSVYWVTEANFTEKDVNLGSPIHQWWGSDWAPDVIPVFRSLDYEYRYESGEGERVSYRDVEVASGRDIDRVIDVCQALGKHDVIEIDVHGGMRPLLSAESIDYSDDIQPQLRKAMSELAP